MSFSKILNTLLPKKGEEGQMNGRRKDWIGLWLLQVGGTRFFGPGFGIWRR